MISKLFIMVKQEKQIALSRKKFGSELLVEILTREVGVLPLHHFVSYIHCVLGIWLQE